MLIVKNYLYIDGKFSCLNRKLTAEKKKKSLYVGTCNSGTFGSIAEQTTKKHHYKFLINWVAWWNFSKIVYLWVIIQLEHGMRRQWKLLSDPW